jgi:hypothetical protein
MTLDEAGAELARIFSGPPKPPGKCLWHHRRYDLARLDDGSIGFVRNALNAEMERIFAEVMEELFGRPEPAEDV